MLINGFVLLCNIVFSVILVKLLAHRGLALAYSISGLLSMAVLGLALRRKIGPYGGRSLVKATLQSVIASALMGVVVYIVSVGLEQVLDVSSKLMQIGQVCICVGVGALGLCGVSCCDADGRSAVDAESCKKKAAPLRSFT